MISGIIEVEVSVTSEGRTFFVMTDFPKTLSTVFPRIILDGDNYYYLFFPTTDTPLEVGFVAHL